MYLHSHRQIVGEMTPDESKKTVSYTNMTQDDIFLPLRIVGLFISFIIKNMILFMIIDYLKVVSKLKIPITLLS